MKYAKILEIWGIEDISPLERGVVGLRFFHLCSFVFYLYRQFYMIC